MVRPRVASSVWRTGGASVTVTVSFAAPTVSTGLNPRVWRASRIRFCCTNVLNPLASTCTVYVPAGRGASVKKPDEDDVRTVAMPVALFVAVILALAMSAPVASLTVPTIAPSPAVCAAACEAAHPRQTISPSKIDIAPTQLPLRSRRTFDVPVNLFVFIRPLGKPP